MYPLTKLQPGDIVLREFLGALMALLVVRVHEGRIVAASAPGIEYEFSMETGGEIDFKLGSDGAKSRGSRLWPKLIRGHSGPLTFADLERLRGGHLDSTRGPLSPAPGTLESETAIRV
jgi:hypothetical protein